MLEQVVTRKPVRLLVVVSLVVIDPSELESDAYQDNRERKSRCYNFALANAGPTSKCAGKELFKRGN